MKVKIKNNAVRALLALVITLLVVSFVTAIMPAKALNFTNDVEVSAGSIYGTELRVQALIKRNNSNPQVPQHTYTYTLYYSKNAEDFPSGNSNLSGSLLAKKEITIDHSIEITNDKPLKTEIIIEVGTLQKTEKIFFTIESKRTGLPKEVVYGYTPVWSVSPLDLDDTDQQYIMDCGSARKYAFTPFGVEKKSEADFTANQSVTWQEFGNDANTGKSWGVVSEYSQLISGTDNSIMGSQLYSKSTDLTFSFEMDNDTTEYDIVMGFKAIDETILNSSADIYVNDDYENVRASYFGIYNEKVVHISGAKAKIGEHNKYFLTLTIKRAQESFYNPTCNFISIRNKSTVQKPVDNKFLTAGFAEINVKNGTKVTELNKTLKVYMTDGEQEVSVLYEELVDANLKTVDATTELQRTFFTINRTAVAAVGVNSNLRQFKFLVSINIWTNEDLYYFINCNQNFPFTPGLERLEYAKENYEVLQNRDSLDKVCSTSDDWGYFGQPMTPYWGNRGPYDSYWAGDSIVYNFPNLPAGDYVFEMGYREPWGGRTMIITFNDREPDEDSQDYIAGRTGSNQKQFRFRQVKDNAPCFIRVTGVGGEALVGWVTIAKDTTNTFNEQPLNIKTIDSNRNLALIIVLPISLVVASGAAVLIILLVYNKRVKNKNS